MTTETEQDSVDGGGGAAEPSPAKLLLVDDRRENLVALAAVLESLGHEMVLASSGAEALKFLLRDDFAVILLDVQMPDLDGFETAALIKQREKTRHIPIIFITAISKDERYVFQGYQSGAVDYLSKPIDADMLRSKVKVFVDLYNQRQEIKRQAEELRLAEIREAELIREEEARAAERRHMAELAEREAQLRQFKSTLDATFDAVFLFDADTLKFFYVNSGATSLLGYAEEELLRMTPRDLEVKTSESELRHLLSRTIEGSANSLPLSAVTYETEWRRKQQGAVPVEVMLQYIGPPDGGRARFVSIVRDITERKQTEARLARMYEREKRIAETLQQSIVLAPPEDLFPGIKIATMYQAAWEEASVGGDYLDVFALDKERIALVVGDISGKGLTAAARTAEVKYALRAFLRETPDPARALTRLNTLLCDTSRLDAAEMSDITSIGSFICVALAVIEPETGKATFALAGCEPPLVVRRQQQTPEPISGAGMPLGIAPDEKHENVELRLEHGDVLLMITDGITEARKGLDFFGYEGFMEAAVTASRSPILAEVGRGVLDAARQFAGGKLQDDACLLLATRH